MATKIDAEFDGEDLEQQLAEQLEEDATQEAVPDLELEGRVAGIIGAAYAVLYTTDPACTWNKQRAWIARLTLPVDTGEIQRRWGGGPYELQVKTSGGKICKGGDIHFALAGPSRLRILAGVEERDHEDGGSDSSFWNGLERHRRAAAAPADDRVSRLERELAELRRTPPAPSTADALMAELARATLLRVTTEQKAGSVGSSLKEAFELQEMLEDFRGEKSDDGPDIVAILREAIPVVMAAIQGGQAPLQIAGDVEPVVAAASSTPATSTSSPAAAAATPPQPNTINPLLARLVTMLESLKEAIASGKAPSDWAVWAADTIGKSMGATIATSDDPKEAILKAVRTWMPAYLELVTKPGAPYVAELIAELEAIAEDAAGDQPDDDDEPPEQEPEPDAPRVIKPAAAAPATS